MLVNTTKVMTGRERMLNALSCKPIDRVPVWLMRQAGRYLPEYRAMKEKYSFLEMVKTPELACEVTLQPLRRFGSLDAAIIFSDILVVPEAMGVGYSFGSGGIQMAGKVDSDTRIQQLQTDEIKKKLSYVGEVIQLVKKEIGHKKAVLGFGGSPWTLAAYMVEGGSSSDFKKLLQLAYSERSLFEKLMRKLVEALKEYFIMQIESGVDAIQIFDSWGGICSGRHYWDFSLKWIKEIIDHVSNFRIPVIVFAKGMGNHYENIVKTGAGVVSFDWTVDMGGLVKKVPMTVGMQGNLDPLILTMEKSIVKTEAKNILEAMRERCGFIFNLGHGITPEAKIENVEALMEMVEAHGRSRA